MEIKKRIVGTTEEILAQVYRDIFKLIGNLNTVKIDTNKNLTTQDARTIKVSGKKMGEYKGQGTLFLGKEDSVLHPNVENNEYINLDEFYEGLKDYFVVNRNKTYVIKDQKTILGICKKKKLSKLELERFQYKTKECSAVILEKVNDPYQDKRSVFIRESGGYEKKVGAISLGSEKRNTKKGFEGIILPDDNNRVEYINKNELQQQLYKIFKDKSAIPIILVALIGLGIVSCTRVEKPIKVVLSTSIVQKENTNIGEDIFYLRPSVGDYIFLKNGTRYFASSKMIGNTNEIGNYIRPEGFYTIDYIAFVTDEGKILKVLNENGQNSIEEMAKLVSTTGFITNDQLLKYVSNDGETDGFYIAYHVNYGNGMNRDKPTGWIKFDVDNYMPIVTQNKLHERAPIEIEYETIINNYYNVIANNNKNIILHDGTVLIPEYGDTINFELEETLKTIGEEPKYFTIKGIKEIDNNEIVVSVKLENFKKNFDDLIRKIKRD